MFKFLLRTEIKVFWNFASLLTISTPTGHFRSCGHSSVSYGRICNDTYPVHGCSR